MSVRLSLVRHGDTDWSEAERFCGWADIPLNDRGRAQARSLGGRLPGPYAGVWSSDLARAVETARLAVGPARQDARLRELDFGDLEGAPWESCPPPLREQLLAFDGFHAPGGESVLELRTRVLDFVGSLQDGHHLVFTHGGVIRALLREIGRDAHVRPSDLRTVML